MMNAVQFSLIGRWEVLAFIAVLLVVQGVGCVPGLVRGLAEGVREFKKASRGMRGPFDDDDDDDLKFS